MKYKLIGEQPKNNYMEQLIAARSGKDAKRLLHPQESDLIDPYNLENIEKGFLAFYDALNGNQRFLIICDADNDGYCSAAIIYQYIKKVCPSAQIDYLIHEGKQHGIADHIENILNSNKEYDLIIIPDAGSNEAEAHHQLAVMKCPILVLDHHLQDEESAENTIIINNQSSPDYENKDLPGAGVTWQFCRYCDRKLGYEVAGNYIDLVALAIASDMMDVTSYENAYILRAGINKEYKNFFFQTLLDKQAYSIGDASKINSFSLAFYIVPLINALIRVGTMEEKEKLFMAFINGGTVVPSTKRGHAADDVERLAEQVARLCVNARSRQNRTKDTAMEQLSISIENDCLNEHKLLVVCFKDGDIDLPSELNGLVAMNLATKYKRPTLVIKNFGDNEYRGSIRNLSEFGFSLKDYLESTGLVNWVAGHNNSAGISVPKGNIESLVARADKDFEQFDFNDNLYEVNFIFCAEDKEVIRNVVEDVDRYHNTFGQGNEEPLIIITGIRLNRSDVQVIGSKLNTIKFSKGGITYIMFNALDNIDDFDKYDTMEVTVVGRANMNEWGGNKTPQIIIEDYNIRNTEFDF